MKASSLKLKWSVLKLLLFGIASSASQSQQDGFQNFMTQAVQAFPEWLESTGRSPASFIPHRINFTYNDALMNVSGFITDHQFGRISESMVPKSISANLLRSYIIIYLNWRNVIVESSYRAEGEIKALSLVTGNGFGRLQYENIETELIVSNLGKTPTGYFNLSTASIGSYCYSIFSTSSFEGVTAGGYEENVIQIMNHAHSQAMADIFPAGEYLKIYLAELFENKSVSEIVSPTVPPSTTPTVPSVRTSTAWPRTSVETTTPIKTTGDPARTPPDFGTTPQVPEISTISAKTTQYFPVTTPSFDTTTTTTIEVSTSTLYPCVSTSLKTILHNETVLEKTFKNGTDGTVLQVTKKLLLVSVIEKNTTSTL